MEEQFRWRLSEEINSLVKRVADKRGVNIDKYVTDFLENLFWESYTLRREEWGERLVFVDDERVFRVATVMVERLLMEAKPHDTPTKPKGRSLLLIGMIEQIRKWWCSWPLCS